MENKIKSQSNPMTASVHWEPEDDSYEDNVVWFETFFALDYEIRMGLGNKEVAEAIEELAGKYHIGDYRKVGEISRIVRDVFIKKIREGEIKNRLMQRIGLNDYDSDHVLIDLKHVIQLVRMVGAEEMQRTTEFLPVMDAISKYPQVANVEIGGADIKNKTDGEFLQPSVRNWLEDYFAHVGTDRHNTLTRSDYLFNSENAKKLDSTDRKKLGIILKSYDNKVPLMIDRETKEILFSNMDSTEIASPPDHANQPSLQKEHIKIEANGDDDFRKKWSGETSIDDKVNEFFENNANPPGDFKKEDLPPDVKSMSFEPGLKVAKPRISSWDKQKEELARQKEKFQNKKPIANMAPIQPKQEPKREEIVKLEEKPKKRPERNVVDLNEYL